MHYLNGTPARKGDIILAALYMGAPFLGVVVGQTTSSDTCSLYAVPIGQGIPQTLTAKECLRFDEAMNPKSQTQLEKQLHEALEAVQKGKAEREDMQNALHNALEGRRVAMEQVTELTRALQAAKAAIPPVPPVNPGEAPATSGTGTAENQPGGDASETTSTEGEGAPGGSGAGGASESKPNGDEETVTEKQ